MDYKLLALDVDGTLIGEDLVIIKEARQAIAAAQEKGVIVTLVTGRMFKSAVKIARELKLNTPIICYQGAMIRHAVTGETIYHKPIRLDLARQFIEEAQKRNYHINAYVNDHLCVASSTPEGRYYAELARVPLEEVGNLLNFVDSPEKEPTKLVIIVEEDQTLGVLREFQDIFGESLYLTRSHARFAEGVNPECSKGAALAALARSVNVPQEQVIAIGDNLNDLPMLEWAGLSVAVGTAAESVRAKAKYVTQGGIGYGVVETIEKFILRNN